MKPERLAAIFFLCVIMIFMCLVPVSFVMFQEDKTAKAETKESNRTIDWKKLYPFSDKGSSIYNNFTGIKVENVYQFLKNKAQDYTSSYLIGNASGVYIAKKYEDIIGWNIASVYEYNGVVKLPDGHLTSYIRNADVSKYVDATIDLDEYCRSKGIDMFYVNAPYKICVSDDKDISGILDFSNQNADIFLKRLADAGIKAYDLRAMLHEDGMNHHEAFYRTDHHWRAETGLWAARRILQALRDDYGWSVKPELLNPDNFEYVVYPEWFLGSYGRKFMLARTRPDDFTFISPKFETEFRLDAPPKIQGETGDFMILCNTSKLISRDYYNTDDTYGTYLRGGQGLTSITNMLAGNDKRVLIVHDSFGVVMIPFLAMGVRHIDAIDLRGMNGSLKKFIDVNKPDLVIVMYHSGELETAISATKRGGHFYFR